jgi:hypothetical protein
MRWCLHCARWVRGTKSIGPLTWVFIIVMSGLTLGLFLLLFVPYYLLKGHHCPICGSEWLTLQPPPAPDAQVPVPSEGARGA